MNNPSNPKERNMIKSAMRRVFSRSELRAEALAKNAVPFFVDANRPRVTKWGFCSECGCIVPRYTLEVDHKLPVIKIEETLSDLTWDQLVDRLWCNLKNLQALCSFCHDSKSKLEGQERRAYKKGLK